MSIKTILKNRWLPWILIVFLVCGLMYLKQCQTPPEKVDLEYLVPTESYNPPIIKLPFVKHKTPVSSATLPIPPKEVDTSIAINVPLSATPVKVGIVINKKGKVFKTKDTPDNITIKVTKWKEPFVGTELTFGLALTCSQDFYAGLSVDLLRVWKLHLGSNVGISQEYKFMAGLHMRYKILTIGYDFLNNCAYFGVVLVW